MLAYLEIINFRKADLRLYTEDESLITSGMDAQTFGPLILKQLLRWVVLA